MFPNRSPAMPRDGFRTSSHSGQDSNCVEVGGDAVGVLIRDTKDRAGPVLAVPAARWRAFTEALKGK